MENIKLPRKKSVTFLYETKKEKEGKGIDVYFRGYGYSVTPIAVSAYDL
jgi:hypothetical protein